MLLTALFERLMALAHLSAYTQLAYRLGAEFAAWGAFFSLFWRALPQARRDTIERSWPRLVGLVRVLIAWGVDLRTAAAAAGYQIVAGVPKADAIARKSATPRPPPLPLLLALGLGVLAGCPRLPPVDLCQPGAQSCNGDRPHVCSQSQRWAPASPRTCASAGLVCCYTRSPFGHDVYACVRAAACLPEGPVESPAVGDGSAAVTTSSTADGGAR
jgi:hypothetical protein